MTDRATQNFVLQFKSPDQPGILARLSPTLYEADCDIREATIYGDPDTAIFFCRMHLSSSAHNLSSLQAVIAPVVDSLKLDCQLFDLAEKTKVLIAVSKFGHCLTDLLHKWKIGSLPIEIVGIVSNHDNMRDVAEHHGVEYFHLPVTKETKPEQEAEFKNIVAKTGADLVVLARYMQVLSDDFSTFLSGRCVNIHHSFLPSFKGAKPYHQAHRRGVKLIGATAHFVTADLDEGPIIEQDVRRVSHSVSAEQMVEIGREVEASVLSRAVKWYAEHRVVLNGQRTVVLSS